MKVDMQTVQSIYVSGAWTKSESQLCAEAVKIILKTSNTYEFFLKTRRLPNGFSWKQVSSFVKTRNPKQCRERWMNHLAPGLNLKEWTPEEDTLLLNLYACIGPRWSTIKDNLMGRSENNIKMRHRYLLRKYKKLMKAAGINLESIKACNLQRLPSLKRKFDQVTALPDPIATDMGQKSLSGTSLLSVSPSETLTTTPQKSTFKSVVELDNDYPSAIEKDSKAEVEAIVKKIKADTTKVIRKITIEYTFT